MIHYIGLCDMKNSTCSDIIKIGLNISKTGPVNEYEKCKLCIYSLKMNFCPCHFLLPIVLSIHRFTASDYSCGILWPLYGLSIDLRLLITPVVSCGHCMVYPLIYGF
jgi:hypothetical protein